MAACTTAQADTVTVKGSDTMVILVQRWIEVYSGDEPGAVVQLTGGGSETGVAALINGTTDIATSSRPLTASEIARVEALRGRPVSQIPVAIDAVAVVVHESNPLEAISLDDLRRIFLGEVTNWRELGGHDGPIPIYGRDHNSGTHAMFRHQILHDEEFSLDALNLVGTATVVDSVAKDPNGIGYGGIAYSAGLKRLHVRSNPGAPAIAATIENARNGSYSLARKLYFAVVEPKDVDTRRFIDWVLSERGQKIVRVVGYCPLAG